jgi:Ca2+/Na+ antiporter
MLNNIPLLLLIGAVASWYVAVRVLVDVFAWRVGHSLTRSLCSAVPLIVLVIIAMIRRDQAMAVSVIFASSVAALSLVLGAVLLSSSTHTIVESHQREWSFVLPTALILMLMGLKSQFSLVHALILIAEAIVLAMLWTDPRRVHPVSTHVELSRNSTSPSWANWFRVILCLGLCVVGGLLASTAAGAVSAQWRLPGNAFISAVLIGPAMMLPLVGMGTQMAHEHRQGEVISTLVGLVLINLLLVLPGVIIASLAIGHDLATTQPAISADAFVRDLLTRPLLTFPHTAWRVDTMMILILSLFLVPFSLNRWLPARLEGFALIVAYVCYLMMSAYSAMVG